VWTTTITVSHWSIQNTDSSKEYPKRFHEGRIKGDFPPASIANLKSANGRSEQGKIQNEKPIIRVIEEFLILLGHLCERLAREHEKMLNQLNTVVDLGVSRHYWHLTILSADRVISGVGKDTA
jgi:hypothetical protein